MGYLELPFEAPFKTAAAAAMMNKHNDRDYFNELLSEQSIRSSSTKEHSPLALLDSQDSK